MADIQIGDIVARKSYGQDIYFKVIDIKEGEKEKIITLRGISFRIEADAPESDLMPLSEKTVSEHKERMRSIVDSKCRQIGMPAQRSYYPKTYYRNTPNDENRRFSRPGKVLHIDGDGDYLDTCIKKYEEFGIEVEGKHVPEKDQPKEVSALLQKSRPDILVLTGHDGVIKGEGSYSNPDNYRTSKFYIEAVKEARRYEADLDSLVVFAGACQSMYREIIRAGANYASSPYRVLIQALDPVFVCQKVAYTNIDRIIQPMEVINNTLTGIRGVGGVQTRGKYRDGYPLEPYKM